VACCEEGATREAEADLWRERQGQGQGAQWGAVVERISWAAVGAMYLS
jgi:hypothetical protein